MSSDNHQSNNDENNDTQNNHNKAYTPPKVWKNDSENGGKFASINRPTAARAMSKNYRSAMHLYSCIH